MPKPVENIINWNTKLNNKLIEFVFYNLYFILDAQYSKKKHLNKCKFSLNYSLETSIISQKSKTHNNNNKSIIIISWMVKNCFFVWYTSGIINKHKNCQSLIGYYTKVTFFSYHLQKKETFTFKLMHKCHNKTTIQAKKFI